MSGMYTCPERVERDGYLIAFKGEIMSEEEARHRGLINDETVPGETKDANQGETKETLDLSKLKKAELLELCEKRGITVSNKATVDQLIELLSE